MHTLEPVRLQLSVLFHDDVCHVGPTVKNITTTVCTMSGGSQDKRTIAIEISNFIFAIHV